MFLLLRPLRFLAKALTTEGDSRQLAWGLALGILVGLIPKGNLIAVVMMMVLCSLRINLGMGMLAAFVFSWVGMLTDPVTHLIGFKLLTLDALKPFWTWLVNQPVVPWTGVNNTVVLGSFVLGLVLLYPVYRYSEPLFKKHMPDIADKLKKYKAVQLLLGAEWTEKLGRA